MEQLVFDFNEREEFRREEIAKKKHSWKICWDWDGPKVGEPLEVGIPCVTEFESGEKRFHYCEPCIAEEEIEPDIWIVRIEFPESAPEYCKMKNGTKLKLSAEEIWAPVGYLSQKRNQETLEQ